MTISTSIHYKEKSLFTRVR